MGKIETDNGKGNFTDLVEVFVSKLVFSKSAAELGGGYCDVEGGKSDPEGDISLAAQ